MDRRTAAEFGFGLHVARVLVEAHGGRIWAESTSPEEMAISFSLPVAQE